MRYLAIPVFFLVSYAFAIDGTYPSVEVRKSYLEKIVHELSVNIGPRNFDNFESLELASKYIQAEFTKLGFEIELQKYSVLGKEVENIIVSLGPKNADRIVVGAHYDSFGNQAGADDNASGVAGLLTLAKLLKHHEREINKRIDLVAFTLEEPPFFRSESMGSYIHARSLNDNNVNVIGMISLEMIGFFNEAKNSQKYPLSALRLFYPDRGNFIGVVSNISSRGLKTKLRDFMSKSNIKVRTLTAPAGLVGIDFSDHLNYCKFGYDAVMITDTAVYRNDNYHQTTDTIETLDFSKMAEVVKGIYYGVLNLASR